MKCIKIIKDEDLGFKSKRYYRTRKRTGARGILINDEGLIAIFNKQNKNEYKLPGGGVDDGENIKDSFIREALEETGCKIEIIKKLGTIEEHKSLDNFKQKSHVFIGKVIKDTGHLHLTQKEIDEGGRVIWVTKEKALELITNSYNNVKPSKYENTYHSKFIIYRDKTILEYYISKLNR